MAAARSADHPELLLLSFKEILEALSFIRRPLAQRRVSNSTRRNYVPEALILLPHPPNRRPSMSH